MSFIPEGFLEAQAVFSTPAEGGPAMVVTGHAQATGIDPDQEATTIAEDVWGGTGSLLSIMSSGYVLTQVNVYANQGDPDLLVGQWNGSEPGLAGTASPPQVAALIQKQSGLAGRHNRGRMYVPGPTTTSVGPDGDIDGTSLTAWQAAADQWHALAIAAQLALYILHVNPAIAPTLVSALSVQALVATQRRRVR